MLLVYATAATTLQCHWILAYASLSALLSHNERPGAISNLMQNILTQIFQRQTPVETVGKVCPFQVREILVMRKERGQGGGGGLEKVHKNLPQPI